MARFKVVPTKTNLARLKRDMDFAQEGYELLEQKRMHRSMTQGEQLSAQQDSPLIV